MSFKFVGGKKYTLAGAGVSSTATSLTLTSFMLPISDTEITMSDFGDIGYGVFEPGTARQEFCSFTGVTQSSTDDTATLTGVVRGLKPNSDYLTSSTYKISHSGGTTFILSNPPSFYSEATFKRNDEVITGSWDFPTPVSDDNAATKKYVDDNVSGGTVTKESEVVAGNAGETVSAGQLLYFDTTDNEWKLADASTTATIDAVKLGIAQGAGTDGNAISGGVLLSGVDKNQSGMTAGDEMFASDTAGAIASSAGTVSRVIGIARNTTNLYFDPNYKYIPTDNEKDAMAGGGDFGTPSTSNKFLTQVYVTAKAQVVQVYTSSDTWTKPAGLSYVDVEVVGGGGGGGGYNTGTDAGGSGGGGGGYSRKKIAVASLGATETVTVGAAGTAGDNSGGAGSDGGNGGNSSFGTHVTANGGSKGSRGNPTAGSQVAGGAGGTSASGDINISGSLGSDGIKVDATTAIGIGGAGGSSVLGKGGGTSMNSASADGKVGSGYGAGGGGGVATIAGAGTAGVVIVREYYL